MRRTLYSSIQHLQVKMVCLLIFSCSTECTKPPGEKAIVFPRLLESRSEHGLKIIQITEGITLTLEKSSVMDKELLLRTYQGDVMQHTYLNGEELERKLYQDTKYLASLMVDEEDGLRLEGVLSFNQRIKPMLEQERTPEGHIPHILYEQHHDEMVNGFTGLNTIEPRMTVAQPRPYGIRFRLPEVVYPELIIIVDTELAVQFDSVFDLLNYFVITVNAVNLKYTTVSEPRVKVVLRAIEVPVQSEEGNIFVHVGGNQVDGTNTLLRLQRYVYRNYAKYGVYDLVYLTTGFDMVSNDFSGWNRGQRGIAFIGGACTSEKVGLGEDSKGTFEGVRIMAHELGHILGCPHDGEQSTYFDSRNCSRNDSYIMTYLNKDSRSMKFSKCCNQMIRRLDVNKTTNCHGYCSGPEGNTTLRVFLPDNSPCNEKGGRFCLNGDCVRNRTKYRYYRPYE